MTNKHKPPQRVVMLDIDALRHKVFAEALAGGKIPNLARLFGGEAMSQGVSFRALANAPSITYSCQASSITGAHPSQHHIPGNMFLDRFGRLTGGKARYYQFDFLDAPLVYTTGLASQVLNPQTPTIFETASAHGLTSTVAYHMFARGAQHWIRPGLDDWALFVQASQPNFGELYDENMINDVISHLHSGQRPDVLLMYFFGLDHESHLKGPGVQMDYLTRVIDHQVGEFLNEYVAMGLFPDTLFCVFSDHGQMDMLNDDLHCLKVGSILDQEYGYVFRGLDLDVNDGLLEGANCEAILSQAGGMAQVYQRRRGGEWAEAPAFKDVLQLAAAFLEASRDGKFAAELKNSLELVMVRDVEHEGWHAGYQVFTPEKLWSLGEYLAAHPELDWIDAPNRLHHMAGPVSGDVLLFANAPGGYGFTILPYRGIHGGLRPDDSCSVLSFGLPEGSQSQTSDWQIIVQTAIEERCFVEGQRQPGNVDVAFGIRSLMGWI